MGSAPRGDLDILMRRVIFEQRKSESLKSTIQMQQTCGKAKVAVMRRSVEDSLKSLKLLALSVFFVFDNGDGTGARMDRKVQQFSK